MTEPQNSSYKAEVIRVIRSGLPERGKTDGINGKQMHSSNESYLQCALKRALESSLG